MSGLLLLLLGAAVETFAQSDPLGLGKIESTPREITPIFAAADNLQIFKGSFTARGRLFHASSGCSWTETWTFSDVRFDLSRRLATFTFKVTQVPLVAGCPRGDQPTSRVRQIPVTITGSTVTGSNRWGSYNVNVQATINGLFLTGTFTAAVTAPYSGSDSGTFRLGEAGCTIKLDNASVDRGSKLRLKATLTPHPAFQWSSVQWRFTGGNGGTRGTGKQLITDVILVDGNQKYTATVTALSTLKGIECHATADLKVNRRPWTAVPTVRTDNEPGWGGLPAIKATGFFAVFGEERDRSSNTPAIIIPSPTVKQTWEKGYRVARVDDPNGPNNGYHFILSTSLTIDQETVINKWIKPSGPRPLSGAPNWYAANHRCLSNPGVFVTAIKNHENRGSGPGSAGHFGLILAAEAMKGMDPRTAIEDNVAATAASLITATNTELQLIEAFLLRASADPLSGNWSGATFLSFWDAAAKSYSDCIYPVGPY